MCGQLFLWRTRRPPLVLACSRRPVLPACLLSAARSQLPSGAEAELADETSGGSHLPRTAEVGVRRPIAFTATRRS
jgi:hypothetical protein